MDEQAPPTEDDPSLAAARRREELHVWETVKRSVRDVQGPEAEQVAQMAQQHIHAARVGITKSKPLSEQMRVLDSLLRAREAAVQRAHEAVSAANALLADAYAQHAAVKEEHAQVTQALAIEEHQKQLVVQEQAQIAARAEADERLRQTPGIAEAVAAWARCLDPAQQAAAHHFLAAVCGQTSGVPPASAAEGTVQSEPVLQHMVLDTGLTGDDAELSDPYGVEDSSPPSPELGRLLTEAAGLTPRADLFWQPPAAVVEGAAEAQEEAPEMAAAFGPATRPFGRRRPTPYTAPPAQEDGREEPALDGLD